MVSPGRACYAGLPYFQRVRRILFFYFYQIIHYPPSALTRRKESRKRNLHFHIPAAVPVSSGLRLVSGDSSYISLQDIYDQHCEEVGIAREDPIIIAGDKTKTVLRELLREVPSAVSWHLMDPQKTVLTSLQPSKVEMLNLKKSVVDEVIVKMIPDDVLIRVCPWYHLFTMHSFMVLLVYDAHNERPK